MLYDCKRGCPTSPGRGGEYQSVTASEGILGEIVGQTSSTAATPALPGALLAGYSLRGRCLLGTLWQSWYHRGGYHLRPFARRAVDRPARPHGPRAWRATRAPFGVEVATSRFFSFFFSILLIDGGKGKGERGSQIYYTVYKM